jgi:signal transduction histidine kinase
MSNELNLLARTLTAPLLEAELSGEKIGRNRLRIISLLSKVLSDAEVQIWLVEEDGANIRARLSYWFPKLDAISQKRVSGNVVIAPISELTRSGTSDDAPRPPAELTKRAKRLFGQTGQNSEFLFPITLPNPIPIARHARPSRAIPLAWAIAATTERLTPTQTAAAQIVAFNLAILLQYGRSQRIVDSTNACTSALHTTTSLDQTLLACANILAGSCAAEGAGYIAFVNGTINGIEFAYDSPLNYAQKRDIENFFRAQVTPVPTLRELSSSTVDGVERHTNPSFGNVLIIPILAPGIYLEDTHFAPISSTDDELGNDCEFNTHAMFLTRKQSPDYLGLNFSATDRSLSRAVARVVTNSAFSRFFEELFLTQTEFFSNIELDQEIKLADALDFVQRIVPGATKLALHIVYRDTTGHFDIETASVPDSSISDKIRTLITEESIRSYPSITATRTEAMEYAVHVPSEDAASLIFRMSTTYVPLRFYVLEIGSRHIEQFRVQLLKHFMRELFHLHRARDTSEERSSLLAQIRHAVVDPLAAATNNIDVFQRYLNIFGREGTSWQQIKSNKEIRDLIPHARYLNRQALLFIDTGRFLFSSLSYSNIKFDQYRPKDLVAEVRLAFDYGLRERNQRLVLKLVGDDNRYAVGDKILLWMAIANLIDNGIKYGRRDTDVTVTINHEQLRWTFAVENIGDYLDPALEADIFRPFVRGRSADTSITRRQGTGIGLTVAQMVVGAHSSNSRVRFVSTRTSDSSTAATRFWFSLPYKIAARDPASTDTSASKHDNES